MQTLSQRKQEMALPTYTNMKGLVLLMICYAYSIVLFLVAAWITSVFIALKGTLLSKVPFSSLVVGKGYTDVSLKEDGEDESRSTHTWGHI